MRPSDFKASQKREEPVDAKPLALSQSADPPITEAEAREADHAVCTWHKGLITVTLDKDGRVFWCPVGKEYWRYRRRGAQWAKLNYDQRGIV